MREAGAIKRGSEVTRLRDFNTYKETTELSPGSPSLASEK